MLQTYSSNMWYILSDKFKFAKFKKKTSTIHLCNWRIIIGCAFKSDKNDLNLHPRRAVSIISRILFFFDTDKLGPFEFFALPATPIARGTLYMRMSIRVAYISGETSWLTLRRLEDSVAWGADLCETRQQTGRLIADSRATVSGNF